MKEYKMGLFIFAIAVLFFGFNIAWSSERHPIVYEPINNTVNHTVDNKGVALGLAASQHNFDMGVNKFQGSVGLGTFQGVDALSFSLGKRYKDILINGSIGSENGLTGYGAGITWRF